MKETLLIKNVPYRDAGKLSKILLETAGRHTRHPPSGNVAEACFDALCSFDNEDDKLLFTLKWAE